MWTAGSRDSGGYPRRGGARRPRKREKRRGRSTSNGHATRATHLVPASGVLAGTTVSTPSVRRVVDRRVVRLKPRSHRLTITEAATAGVVTCLTRLDGYPDEHDALVVFAMAGVSQANRLQLLGREFLRQGNPLFVKDDVV